MSACFPQKTERTVFGFLSAPPLNFLPPPPSHPTPFNLLGHACTSTLRRGSEASSYCICLHDIPGPAVIRFCCASPSLFQPSPPSPPTSQLPSTPLSFPSTPPPLPKASEAFDLLILVCPARVCHCESMVACRTCWATRTAFPSRSLLSLPCCISIACAVSSFPLSTPRVPATPVWRINPHACEARLSPPQQNPALGHDPSEPRLKEASEHRRCD